MMVCHATRAALELLAEQREVLVGVHLTLTEDFRQWAWSPLTAGESIQEGGLLLPIEKRDLLMGRAVLSEVEAEFRAQIEAALGAGIEPTHLDWHCLADGGRADIFDATLALAEEYRVGIRAWTGRGRSVLLDRGRVPQDQPFLDSFSLPVDRKEQRLIERIRALPVGLSEWAMHPARPGEHDSGADVRSTDRDVLMSPSFREVLEEESIRILGWDGPQLLANR
jgi:predicted glycoside hydrolase/deacetylase ChbG (UPF0249 family)